jgi:hypothetical protein
MQTLASAQGNKLVYAKVLEGADCYPGNFTGFGTDAKDNDIRIENKKTGCGRPHHRRSAAIETGVLVDPDGRRARTVHRSGHRAGPAVHVGVYVRLLHD